MRNLSVTSKMLAAALAFGMVVSTGTALARDYEMTELHEGGIDPNSHITSVVAVGSQTTAVSWIGLQGPFRLEASTNLTDWFSVTPLTNVLSGCFRVANPSTNSVSFRLAGPALQYMSVSAGCQACHPNTVNKWSYTAHAGALRTLAAMSPSQATNTSCLSCHTVGYGYQTGYNLTNTPYLGGVQCENCHGPAGGHAGEQYTPAVTLSALMCGGCHQAVNPENNHSVLVDWETAGHAEVNEEFGATFLTNNLAASEGRMGACGFCHSGAVRLSLLNNEGALPSGPEAFEIGQTCVVCHDPHDAHPENGGYHLRNPMSSTNYYNFATSQTGQPAYTNVAAINYGIVSNNFWKQYNPAVQICAQCHNARGATYTSASRPPHHSGQYNMLLGNLGITEGTPPQGAHATNCVNQCADCHMNLAALPGHTNSAEHTFSPNTNACAVCHVTDPETLITTTHEEFSNRIVNVVGVLRNWALTAASDKLTSSKSNAWEYSTAGSLSVTNGAPPPSTANQVWVPADIQKARFNLYLVAYDGSLGIHNAPYGRHLLDVASNLVVGLTSSSTVSAAMSDWNSTSTSVQPYDSSTSLTIRVQARNVNGKKMTTGGDTVAISVVNSVGSIGSTSDSGTGIYYAVWSAPSDTNGARAIFRATLNGSTVGTSVGATQIVATLVGPVDASHSTISPLVATNVANGVSNRTITVQARDVSNNNRISGGDTVVFFANVGTMGSTSNLNNGTYTAKWTVPSNTVTNPALIWATLGGINVGTAVSASNSVITLTP